MRAGRADERGAALLSVLLLVAVMAVIAAVMLDRLHLATRLAANGQAMTRARMAATSAETLALARAKALVAADPARTVDRSGLLGRTMTLPLGQAMVDLRVEDAGNCFNVNSLVEQDAQGVLTLRPAGLWQLRALMASLGMAPGESYLLSDAMADWIDSDDAPAPNGAEDGYYRALPVPYRTAGRLMGDVSELRAVKGMTPLLYQRLRPWLCALPVAELSPVNINTLRPEQARLLTMLAPQALPLERARAIIAARPAQGFSDTAVLQGAMGAAGASAAGAGQVQVRSRWFLMDEVVRIDRVQVQEQALVDAGLDPARVVFRSWGGEDAR
ncbi:MAG: hypothetical protein RIS94_1962 [Pseudomonadota bacterium]